MLANENGLNNMENSAVPAQMPPLKCSMVLQILDGTCIYIQSEITYM